MDTVWPERGYFGLLRNDNTLVYYPIIYFQRIKVYKFAQWIWEYSAGTIVSAENAIPLITIVFIVRYEVPW